MNELIAKDLAHIWHPCTQMKDHEFIPLLDITSAKGVYLKDRNGRKYVDCISSWWVNLFGHCNPQISKAISDQAKRLEHVLLAGCTHEQIIKLSERLINLLPARLSKCFYADNGSSAIEVALKMSFHKHLLKGEQRPNFISLSHSYHGETIAALSISDVGLYKLPYEPLCFKAIYTPSMASANEDFTPQLREFERILNKHAKSSCALIIEPLIQCAGNMRMHSAEFALALSQMARSAGLDVIYDEIAVGFGRTGSMFALEQIGFEPDFLCLSKGISGGYLPLSVVITSDEVYNAFYAPYEDGKAFLHSHSYTGNALACAAANASLDIFARQNIIESNKLKSAAILAMWQSLAKLPCVSNLRHCGMVFAFDITPNAKASSCLDAKLSNRLGIAVYLKALERGLLLRPLGNTIYFMPPYVISLKTAKFVISQIKQILRELFC